MVAVTVATTAARRTLGPEEQVRFFRALGRRYGITAGLALTIFAITGLALAGAPAGYTATQTAVAALTALIAALTAIGVINARAVQRLRAQALQTQPTRRLHPDCAAPPEPPPHCAPRSPS